MFRSACVALALWSVSLLLPKPASAQEEIDPCTLLTKPEAAELLGTPLGDEPKRDAIMCHFISASDPKDQVFVSVLSLGPATKPIYESKAGEAGTVPAAGIGDAAFSSSEERASPKEYYFTVLAGTAMLQIVSSGIHQDDPKAALLKAAQAAAPRLKALAKE
jgi:hypothetical protein